MCVSVLVCISELVFLSVCMSVYECVCVCAFVHVCVYQLVILPLFKGIYVCVSISFYVYLCVSLFMKTYFLYFWHLCVCCWHFYEC